MKLPYREDMSYNEYFGKSFGSDCLFPYSLYRTKKFLFFKRKVFLKNMPCGICYNCLKNKGHFNFGDFARSSFDLEHKLEPID